jgi:hypothetical protein
MIIPVPETNELKITIPDRHCEDGKVNVDNV